jgi:hypothetical protein
MIGRQYPRSAVRSVAAAILVALSAGMASAAGPLQPAIQVGLWVGRRLLQATKPASLRGVLR